MNCYDCNQEHVERVALGVCHTCGAGLCTDHTHETKHTVKINQAFFARVTVDPPQRGLLCLKCGDSMKAANQLRHSPLKAHS